MRTALIIGLAALGAAGVATAQDHPNHKATMQTAPAPTPTSTPTGIPTPAPLPTPLPSPTGTPEPQAPPGR